MNFKAILPLLLLGSLLGSPTQAAKKNPKWASEYKAALFQITEVMVSDVASPPVAARIYAYSNLAAYLLIKQQGIPMKHPDFLRYSYIADHLPSLSAEKLESPQVAAIYAMLLVAEKINPSGYLLLEKQEAWKRKAVKNKWVKRSKLKQHLTVAQEIAETVLSLASEDGYTELTALNRYSPSKEEGRWYPTPPAYIAPVEPEWQTVRPFFIEDLKTFDPAPMAPFSMEEGSSFHTQLMEIVETTRALSEEQELIANFWDCNPFKVEFTGHMVIGVKKISPGGHWMGITGIAAEKANLNFPETAYIHALVGLTLHDAFISCWRTKYETDRIRPETVINQQIDQRWRPLLQTPPFPEYTSGHSVISRASAIILTGYFGDNFSFRDDSEVYFGLPERDFDSFLQASEEAAISRLYGGIHFRDAIEEGVKQGEQIGTMIWGKIRTDNLVHQ